MGGYGGSTLGQQPDDHDDSPGDLDRRAEDHFDRLAPLKEMTDDAASQGTFDEPVYQRPAETDRDIELGSYAASRRTPGSGLSGGAGSGGPSARAGSAASGLHVGS